MVVKFSTHEKPLEEKALEGKSLIIYKHIKNLKKQKPHQGVHQKPCKVQYIKKLQNVYIIIPFKAKAFYIK